MVKYYNAKLYEASKGRDNQWMRCEMSPTGGIVALNMLLCLSWGKLEGGKGLDLVSRYLFNALKLHQLYHSSHNAQAESLILVVLV